MVEPITTEKRIPVFIIVAAVGNAARQLVGGDGAAVGKAGDRADRCGSCDYSTTLLMGKDSRVSYTTLVNVNPFIAALTVL